MPLEIGDPVPGPTLKLTARAGVWLRRCALVWRFGPVDHADRLTLHDMEDLGNERYPATAGIEPAIQRWAARVIPTPVAVRLFAEYQDTVTGLVSLSPAVRIGPVLSREERAVAGRVGCLPGVAVPRYNPADTDAAEPWAVCAGAPTLSGSVLAGLRYLWLDDRFVPADRSSGMLRALACPDHQPDHA